MYELKHPIVFDNLNDYFVHAKTEDAELYFAHFLCCYEKTLDYRATQFLKHYSDNTDRINDLKQIFAVLLWDKLKSYQPENPIPFLQTVKYDVIHAWHEYFRTSCGATTIAGEKTYAAVRRAAQIYYSLENQSEEERIKAVCSKLKISAEKTKQLLFYASQFRYASTDDSEDTTEEQSYAAESSPSAEEEYFIMRRREIIRGVAEKLKHNDLQIISLTVGVCPFCFGNIPPSERRTYEQLALLQGASSGNSIEKKRKRILKNSRMHRKKKYNHFFKLHRNRQELIA